MRTASRAIACALTAAVGAGAVAGSLAASMLVTGRRLAAVERVGVALWGLPLVLIGAVPGEPVVLALMVVIGVGDALVDVGVYTVVPRLVPEDLLARVFGALESLIAPTVAIGGARTPLRLHTLDRHHFLSALSSYNRARARPRRCCSGGSRPSNRSAAGRPTGRARSWSARPKRRSQVGEDTSGASRSSSAARPSSRRPRRDCDW